MQDTTKRIRVLVVDDSVFFRTVLSNLLIVYPNLQVVGTAADPYEARAKIAELKPDVLTLDINMPKMNGIDFLKEYLPRKWIPVVVISSREDRVFEAMNAGAVEFVEKPTMTPRQDLKEFGKDIAEKIVAASQAMPTGRKRQLTPMVTPAITASQKPRLGMVGGPVPKGLIALGASTGGTEATSYILKQLPADIPGMVIVQHMPPVFTDMYAKRLDRESKLSVKEAEEGDVILTGHAYVAPGDKHLTVEKIGADMILHCREGEKVNGHKPSVDVMFDSVARFADRNTVGIILTGMGADGARGITQLKRRGAFTIGQDEASSVVYGMPMVAYKMGGISVQVPLDEIPSVLLEHLF